MRFTLRTLFIVCGAVGLILAVLRAIAPEPQTVIVRFQLPNDLEIVLTRDNLTEAARPIFCEVHRPGKMPVGKMLCDLETGLERFNKDDYECVVGRRVQVAMVRRTRGNAPYRYADYPELNNVVAIYDLETGARATNGDDAARLMELFDRGWRGGTTPAMR